MQTKKFSNKEAISFGWEAMKNNLGFFILTFLIMFGIHMIFFVIQKAAGKDNTLILGPLFLVRLFIDIVIGMGFIKIAVKLSDNMKVEISDLFSCMHLFFKYLLGNILLWLLILAGFLLLIVPGFIFMLKYQYVPYLIIDKGMDPIESFGKSAKMTNGAKNDLFVFWFVLGLINIAGALCLLIGLIATLPTTMVAMAYVYRKLQVQADAKIAIPAQPTA